MIDILKKKLLRNYGIFLGLLVGIFVILLTVSFLTRKTWVTGLKKQVSATLEANIPGEYNVGVNIPIHSPQAVNAACYLLKKNNKVTTSMTYGIIIRIMTIYGPMPAVFTYDTISGAQFIGFACMEKLMEQQIAQVSLNSSIHYWKMRIPLILTFLEGKNE